MKRDQFLKLLSEIEYQNSLYLERKKKLNPKRFKEMVKAKIAKLWKNFRREIFDKFGSDIRELQRNEKTMIRCTFKDQKMQTLE